MKKRGKINILGIATQVVEALPEEVEEGILDHSDYSSYDADTSTITLNATIKEADMKCFYATHETVHGACAHSGLMVALKEKFQLTDDETRDLEEQIVTSITPTIFGAHKSLSMLFARLRRTS